MGIHGWFQFFTDNKRVVGEEIEFRNETLIIDGDSLLNKLNDNDFKNDAFGGNLVQFGNKVFDFFNALKQCKIRPIVVHDGASVGVRPSEDKPQIAPKEATHYQKNLERFTEQYVHEWPQNRRQIFVSQLLNAVFRRLLQELDVPRIQAVHEADALAARLANKYECPVLSADSDFFIYNLKRGFFNFRDFKYKDVISMRKSHIVCYLCSQRKTIESLPNLEPASFAIMSCIIGNDYFPKHLLSWLLDELVRKHTNLEPFWRTGKWEQKRIACSLLWLNECGLEQAKKDLLEQVPEDEQEQVMDLIEKLIRVYNCEICEDFDEELDRIYPPTLRINTDDQLLPRQYLKNLFETMHLDRLCMSVITHTPHYEYKVVDDFQLPSSLLLRERPLALASALLRTRDYQGMRPHKRESLIRDAELEVWDRDENNVYSGRSIRVMRFLYKFGSLDHLDCYKMIVLEEQVRLRIVMSCFYFDENRWNLMKSCASPLFVGSWQDEVALCMTMIDFINTNAGMKTRKHFIEALLLTMFFYAASEYYTDMTASSGLIVDNRDGLDRLVATMRRLLFAKNSPSVYEDSDKGIFRNIMHSISQLQVSYRSYIMINALLGCPHHVPKLEKFLNFTLTYNLVKRLRLGHVDIDDYAKHLPILGSVAKEFVQLIEQNQLRLMLNNQEDLM